MKKLVFEVRDGIGYRLEKTKTAKKPFSPLYISPNKF